jgi:hypothetical protein
MVYVLKRINQDGTEEVLLRVELPKGTKLKLEEAEEITITEMQGWRR